MKIIDSGIIYKSLRGRATEEEEALVSKWYEENPEECGRIVKDIHTLIDLTELSDIKDGKYADGYCKNNRNVFRRILSATAGIAAAIALIASVSYTTYRITENSYSEKIITMSVPKGDRMHLILPDSTSVILNSGAEIKYPAVFKRNLRSVSLSGEAMFNVKHDQKCPFIVNTFASRIKVLGTEFNVLSDEKNGISETVLLKGSVIVKNLIDTTQPDIIMKPDDKVALKNGRFMLGQLENKDDLCWIDGLIYIGNLPFDELMNKFEYAFDVKICLECKTVPDISTVSGKIRTSDGIYNALRILQHAADFKFRKGAEPDEIIIY